MGSRTAELRRAYEATLYTVHAGAEPFVLRVGVPPPAAFTTLCARHGAEAAAFITAFNPASAQVDPAANARRHRELARALEATGHTCYEGEGVDPSGEWPPEASVLAVGLDEREAMVIAARFGQYAFVRARVNAPVALVFTPVWHAVERSRP